MNIMANLKEWLQYRITFEKAGEVSQRIILYVYYYYYYFVGVEWNLGLPPVCQASSAFYHEAVFAAQY